MVRNDRQDVLFKVKKKIFYLCIFFIFVIIVFLIPIVLDRVIIYITNGQWASFLGSYLGGIIGGLITLIGVLLSLNYSIKYQDENKRLTVLPFINVYSELDLEQTKLLNTGDSVRMPHLEINKDKVMSDNEEETNKDEEEKMYLTLSISNVGSGNAIDFNFDRVYIGEQLIPEKNIGFGILDKVLLAGDQKELNIDIIITRNIIDRRSVFMLYQDEERMKTIFRFKDMLGNKYNQTIYFESVLILNKIDVGGWIYTVSSIEAPHLV